MDSFEVYLLVVFVFAIPTVAVASFIHVKRAGVGAALIALLPLCAFMVERVSTPVNLNGFSLFPVESTLVPAAFAVCVMAYARLDAKRARVYPWSFALGYVLTLSGFQFDEVARDSDVVWARLRRGALHLRCVERPHPSIGR